MVIVDLLLDAPQVNITVMDSASVEVIFIPPEDTTGITHYKAVISDATGGNCSIMAWSVPLVCNISGLEAGKMYTVSAYACSIACSPPKREQVKLVPQGERPRYIYFLNIHKCRLAHHLLQV